MFLIPAKMKENVYKKVLALGLEKFLA